MGCNSCKDNPCNPKDCGCQPEDCGCKFYIESLACIRHDGNDLDCLGAKKGDTLETIITKIDEKICNVQNGSDGDSAYDIAVSEGFEGTIEEWLESLVGPQGDEGDQGDAGVNGLHGRGVAVFIQDAEPDQDDFDSLYGSVSGFGTGGIAGANTFNPGDLWIGTCSVE